MKVCAINIAAKAGTPRRPRHERGQILRTGDDALVDQPRDTPVSNSIVGYRLEMGVPQSRQRALRINRLSTGTLSYHRMPLPHAGQ